MLTIQSVMLVLLGFLLATLLVLMLVPAYRRRVDRLVMSRVRSTMPLTEAEIRADKDRLRAEYAIKLHRLEVEGEKQTLSSARQQIELNRRDAAISTLEGEIATMRTMIEGYENAHRVLEQTITERVPSLELRLSEARKLAFQRDREITELKAALAEQTKALEEATLARAQSRDELLKANSLLATYAARSREVLADPSFNAEAALRAEIGELRAKLADGAKDLAAARRAVERARDGAAVAEAQAATAVDPAEVAQLRASLAQAEAALQVARQEASAGPAKSEIESQLREMRALAEDRAAEIARLGAALQTYETGDTSHSLKDSRIAMKARLGALQAERDQQVATIQRMRGELASANERLARQAQHFTSEMRRFGAVGRVAAQPIDAEGGQAATEDAAALPIAARLSESAAAVARRAEKALDSGPQLIKRMAEQELPRMRGFLKSLGGSARAREHVSLDEAGAERPREREPVVAEAGEEIARAPEQPRARQRLVERLSDATKN